MASNSGIRGPGAIALTIAISALLIGAGLLGVSFHNQRVQALKKLEEVKKQNRHLASQLRSAKDRTRMLVVRNEALLTQRAEIPRLRGEVSQLRRELRDRIELPQRVATLTGQFRTADAWIPGLALLPQDEWIAAASLPLDTQEEVRRAMAGVRKKAVQNLASTAQAALSEFAAANGGRLPADGEELMKSFPESLRRELVGFASIRSNISQPGGYVISSPQRTAPTLGWVLEINSNSYHYRIKTDIPPL